MYCGKPPGYTCKENDECSSKDCKNNNCQFQEKGPSDGGIKAAALALIFAGVIIIIIIIAIICCYCYKKKYKK